MTARRRKRGEFIGDGVDGIGIWIDPNTCEPRDFVPALVKHVRGIVRLAAPPASTIARGGHNEALEDVLGDALRGADFLLSLAIHLEELSVEREESKP